MSPPDTNLEKQKRRHWGPLWGIGLAVLFAVGLFLWWITYVVEQGGPPQGAETRINGATGEPVDADEPTLVVPAE